MLKRMALAVFVLFALGGGATAQESALITFKVLSPPVALEAASAAMQACQDKGFQVAVAVVDRFGTVQVILRDLLAGPHTPETARRKAWTAVSFRSDTLSLVEFTQSGEAASGVRFVEGALMLGGGVPVEAGGSTVAAIGVSGAPGGDEDDACARAGIAAIDDKIQF